MKVLLLLIRIKLILQLTRTAALPASTSLSYSGWLLALFALPRFKMALRVLEEHTVCFQVYDKNGEQVQQAHSAAVHEE